VYTGRTSGLTTTVMTMRQATAMVIMLMTLTMIINQLNPKARRLGIELDQELRLEAVGEHHLSDLQFLIPAQRQRKMREERRRCPPEIRSSAP